MDEILTCCEYRCDLCLAYRSNVETNPSNRHILSDGWFKYFGFRIEPKKLFAVAAWPINQKPLIRNVQFDRV